MKSSRRHDSLIPLSHDHHHALVLCLRIHRGLTEHSSDADWLLAKADDVLSFLENDLMPHFAAEERVLFPAMRGMYDAADLLAGLDAEHRTLERLVEALRHKTVNTLADTLKQFADLLESHIRKEERELFPIYEGQVSEDAAAQVGQGILKIKQESSIPAR